MRLHKRTLWAVAGLVFLLGASGLFFGRGSLAGPAQQAGAAGKLYIYSAKFVCGTAGITPVGPDPVVAGHYATAINVHNPSNETTVILSKKAVLALPEDEPPVPPGAWFDYELWPNHAFEIDCADINFLLGLPNLTFYKGFVVIYSPQELDVVAVYTSTRHEPQGIGLDLDTERIEPQTPFAPGVDNDNDGCTWEEEAFSAPPPEPGSTCTSPATCYSDGNGHDFYDVPVPAVADPDPNGPGNHAVTMGDVLAVLFYVGTYGGGPPNPNGVDYDSVKGSCDWDADTTPDAEGLCYDRSPGPEPNPPWDARPPNGAVNMQDVLANLAQVGLACSGPP